MNELQKLLIERAGLSQELIDKGTPDEIFEGILDALKSIHTGKGVLYGSYLETHGSEPANFCLIQHFCDTKRKYVRAENFVKQRADGVEHDINELLDTYSDLAIYAIMGIQLINHLQQRRQSNENN